jgi:hypothetical protein
MAAEYGSGCLFAIQNREPKKPKQPKQERNAAASPTLGSGKPARDGGPIAGRDRTGGRNGRK